MKFKLTKQEIIAFLCFLVNWIQNNLNYITILFVEITNWLQKNPNYHSFISKLGVVKNKCYRPESVIHYNLNFKFKFQRMLALTKQSSPTEQEKRRSHQPWLFIVSHHCCFPFQDNISQILIMRSFQNFQPLTNSRFPSAWVTSRTRRPTRLERPSSKSKFAVTHHPRSPGNSSKNSHSIQNMLFISHFYLKSKVHQWCWDQGRRSLQGEQQTRRASLQNWHCGDQRGPLWQD